MGLWDFTPYSIISSYDFSEKPAASIFRVKGRKTYRTEQCKTEEDHSLNARNALIA